MNKYISYSALIIALISLSLILYINYNQKEIYIIENGKLYDSFKLKKEFEIQIQNIRNSRRNILDSLELNIRQYKAKNMIEEYQFSQEFYLEKVKTFEIEEEGLLEEYNNQIWKRLNQYAIDYGKENNIDILFGASGNGTVLHVNEKLNITEKFIEYANKRYDGK